MSLMTGSPYQSSRRPSFSFSNLLKNTVGATWIPMLVALCVFSGIAAGGETVTAPLTISLSANPVLFGTTPTAIAVIGCTDACGTATFLIDNQVFQVLPVRSDGTIPFPPLSPSLPLGGHTLTVQYSGNAQHDPATASYDFNVVSTAPISQSLSLSVNPVPVDQTPVMVDSIGCDNCGYVFYYVDHSRFEQSGFVVPGLAVSLLRSNLTPGWHILTITLHSGPNFDVLSDSSIAFHVIPDTLPVPTLSAALESSPLVAGTTPPGVITALGCEQDCRGWISYYMDGALFEKYDVSANGWAPAPPICCNLQPGTTHTVTARYSGDTNHAPATTSFDFTVVSTAPPSQTLDIVYNSVSPYPPVIVSDETPVIVSQITSCNACGYIIYALDGTAVQYGGIYPEGYAFQYLATNAPLPYSQLPVGKHILTASLYVNDQKVGTKSRLFYIVPDTLPVPSLAIGFPSNPVIAGTSLYLGTALGCAANCQEGWIYYYMDGQVFERYTVYADGHMDGLPIRSTLSVGPHTVTAKYSGDSRLAPVTASYSFMVSAANHGVLPTITWPKPPAISYGTALSAAQLNATASVPGTFTYNPSGGTVLPASGPTVLSVTFTPTDTATYMMATQSVILDVAKTMPTITWAAPAAITYGTGLSVTQLNASASVPGTLLYNPTDGTILPGGSNTLTVTFAPNDGTRYTAATMTVTLTVNPDMPVLTWNSPAAIASGTPLSGVQLNATASVPGSFSYAPPSGTVLAPGLQNLTTSFTPSDTVDYTAVGKSVSINVSGGGSQTALTLASSSSSSTYGVPVTFTATLPAGASGMVAFLDGGTSIGTGTINGSTATLTTSTLAAGNHTMTAFWAGNGGGALTSGALSQAVARATPVVTWATPSSVAPGTALSGTQLNAAASVAGTFAYSPGSGTVLNASQTLSVAFTPSDSANYNPASAQVQLTVTAATGTPGMIYSFSVKDASDQSGYAANGNVVAYKDSVNGIWTNLGYDSLNRLTGGTQVPVGGAAQYFCWTYDSFGNRTLQSSSSAPYTSGSATCQTSGVPTTYAVSYNSNNRITQTPSSTPSYDAAGNITIDDNNQYLYDDEGRVCAVHAPPPIAGMLSMTQYIYDAEGRRVAKGTITSFSCDMATNGFSLTASYVLGQGGEQVTEMNGNGQWVHTNVFAGGQLMATYDPDGTHFQITDWLGSRRVQADYQGRVESTYQNLPFGELVPTNTNPPLGATEHHFTGKERDTESGLDYFGARYYSSNMGRFSSPDDGSDQNSSDPQSLNLYSYVRNNPVANTDPSGNDCVTQTRTSDTTESVSVNSGNCSGKVGDGQTQTYVNGTVTGISVNGGNSLDIGYNSYDGQSSGVTNAASAPTPDRPGLAYGYGNNAQGYQMLGAASRAVNTTTAVYAGIFAAGACAALCPEAAAAGLANIRALTGLIPAVPSAIEKLQKLGISLERAREIVQTEEGYVDNANTGMFGTGSNVNYIVNEGGKMIRITTDAAGTKIISAGRVAGNFVNRGVASGRLTLR